MIKKILLLIVMVSTQICFGQNLVPNGDFETNSGCPTGYSQIGLATPWMTPSTGSPDYFHVCSSHSGTQVPYNNWGFQYPHGGDGYCGLVLFQLSTANTREYIEVQLSNVLQAGQCYDFEMFVNLGNNCQFTGNEIQVYFSDTIMQGIGNYAVISKPYQLEYTGVDFDTTNWMQIAGTYEAVGGESYLMIGNYLDDMNTDTVHYVPGNIQSNIYVYIDDISLVEVACDAGIMESSTWDFAQVYPNPFTNEFTVMTDVHGSMELVIYDAGLRAVYRESFAGTKTVDLEALAPGMYLYEINNGRDLKQTGKLIKQ